MAKILAFCTDSRIDPARNIEAFVSSCRNELTTFGAGVAFDDHEWDVTESLRRRASGNRERIFFCNLASVGSDVRVPLSEPFCSFAKAYMLYMQGFRPVKSVHPRLSALRALERSLQDGGGRVCPTQLTAANFNIAAKLSEDRYSAAAAHSVGSQLEVLAKFLNEHYLVVTPIYWKNYLKQCSDDVRVGKEFDERRKARLPSDAALNALPEIYRAAKEPKDVLVTSVVAILCSAPCRIGEVLALPNDCEVTEDQGGKQLYGLRWWPSKGAAPYVKWVVPSMVQTVKEAISRIRRLTDPARAIASWYGANPERLYLPTYLESLRSSEWISFSELGDLIGSKSKTSPGRWARSARLEIKKTGGTCWVRFAEVEKIMLSKLPRWFPILDPERELEYKDALFVIRSNEMSASHGVYTCMVEPFSINQFNIPLGSCVHLKRFGSIFRRFGFFEPDGSDIRVTTHQFRHYLNTLAQSGGLSQLDIAKWSGRVNLRQNRVYDHVSADELLVKVRSAIGKDSEIFGPLARVSGKLPVSRDKFGALRAPTAHTTDYGFCIHDFTMSPCRLHLDCLHCSDHICVKGDESKRTLLGRRLEEARVLMERSEAAVLNGDAGSNRWLDHHRSTVDRLSQLDKIMNDPTVPAGSIIQLGARELPPAVEGRGGLPAGPSDRCNAVETGASR